MMNHGQVHVHDAPETGSPFREEPIVFRCGVDRMIGVVTTRGTSATVGVLVVVGGPQYRVGSHRQFVSLARAVVGPKVAAMRFDCRGMGDSDGTPRSFDDIGDDMDAAIRAFQTAVPSLRRVVLWGLCDAASAILISGCANPSVAGIVLVNPWVRTATGEAQAYIKHYYWGRLAQRTFWLKLLSGKVAIRASILDLLAKLRRSRDGAQGTNGGSFVERMLRGLESFRGPLLILISGRDLTAREFCELSTNASAWKLALALSNVTTVHLQNADHTFSSRSALDHANCECIRWIASLAAKPEDGNA